MLKVLGILAITAIIIAIDVPPMIKKNQKKECYAFFILLIPAAVTSVLLGLNVHFPNIGVFIKWLVDPLSSWLQAVFH